MAWEDDVEPDLVHELPFWLVAAMAHGALLTLDPVLRWGKAARADEKVIPVEFVAQLPVAQHNLAPAAGDGRDGTPRHGPGTYEAPKVKQGAADPPPKAKPAPKPAAAKGPAAKPGATVKPQAAKAVAAPARDPAAERREESRRILAAAAARRQAEAAQAARLAAEERARARAEAAAAARAEASERARVQAERRAAAEEAARQERARLAAEKAERARQAAEAARLERERVAEARRLEAERQAALAAERRRVLAEQKAAKAARRAELSSALATMDEPDEFLDAGAAPPASGRRGGGSPMKGPARSGAGRAAVATALAGLEGEGGEAGAAGPGAGLRGAARAGAAAALAESPDPGDVAGSGGGDLIDAPARGGGEGPEGGGVSMTVDGAVGNRRMVSRVMPTSPDWVGTRGLDLTVTVRFQVLPDGRVRPGAVQKTSGFPEIDARALEALRRWRFEAAPGAKGEVWGRVTFRFTS